MKTKIDAGFTLVELLLVLAISAILLASVIPSFGDLVNHAAKQSASADLISALNLSRNTAVAEQTTITICPLNRESKCTDDWSLPVTVFRDPDRSKTVLESSQIVRVVSPPENGRLIVRSGIRNYFRFRGTGLAREAIGNIIWCPDSDDPTLATQIRINMGGRPLIAVDSDGDGVAEDAYGQPIACSET